MVGTVRKQTEKECVCLIRARVVKIATKTKTVFPALFLIIQHRFVHFRFFGLVSYSSILVFPRISVVLFAGFVSKRRLWKPQDTSASSSITNIRRFFCDGTRLPLAFLRGIVIDTGLCVPALVVRCVIFPSTRRARRRQSSRRSRWSLRRRRPPQRSAELYRSGFAGSPACCGRIPPLSSPSLSTRRTMSANRAGSRSSARDRSTTAGPWKACIAAGNCLVVAVAAVVLVVVAAAAAVVVAARFPVEPLHTRRDPWLVPAGSKKGSLHPRSSFPASPRSCGDGSRCCCPAARRRRNSPRTPPSLLRTPRSRRSRCRSRRRHRG
mmetsp:Transcript_42787/g.89125  ORF Transcript_42787/g.89125 Transcript_42787/m.89125 type:complete len:323 (+) Transcript_42787:139-1107(+)